MAASYSFLLIPSQDGFLLLLFMFMPYQDAKSLSSFHSFFPFFFHFHIFLRSLPSIFCS
ncbi:hypothetical protein LINPERHAP1_LOCUS26317, partial [Linum perenne]